MALGLRQRQGLEARASTLCVFLFPVVQAMAAKNAEFEAAIKAADTPYMKDVLARKQECECATQQRCSWMEEAGSRRALHDRILRWNASPALAWPTRALALFTLLAVPMVPGGAACVICATNCTPASQPAPAALALSKNENFQAAASATRPRHRLRSAYTAVGAPEASSLPACTPAVMKDASNVPLEELLAPEVVTEKMDIELAELAVS